MDFIGLIYIKENIIMNPAFLLGINFITYKRKSYRGATHYLVPCGGGFWLAFGWKACYPVSIGGVRKEKES